MTSSYENLVPSLVITGGDCAGKTSLICALAEHYQEQIIVTPEAATLFYGSPLNPLPDLGADRSKDWVEKFQVLIASTQIAFECQAQDLAKETGAKLIISDRGLFDHYGFLQPTQWDAFSNSLELTDQKIASRYSAVLYLESLIISDIELWREIKMKNNPQRRVRDEAGLIDIENRLRSAWERHETANGRLETITGKRTEEDQFLRAKNLCDELMQ